MDMDDERIREAVKHTEIVRLPKQSLSTFGITNIYYYLVTKPAYSELVKDDPLTSIIKGEDELWDVSLLKFIYEMTARSVRTNLQQMGARGLLNIDAGGIPADARVKIEELFGRVASGESEPRDLKEELDRWGLFEEYQDRFFALFKGKR